MKSYILNISMLFAFAILSSSLFAQTKNITLEQTPGAFSVTSLEVEAGDYQFNIANNGVDHQVGFVLVPKGKYDQANHIQAAYVSAPVDKGSSSLTKVVSLEAGEYEYFCPLNPTPKYALTVKESAKMGMKDEIKMKEDMGMKKTKMAKKAHSKM